MCDLLEWILLIIQRMSLSSYLARDGSTSSDTHLSIWSTKYYEIDPELNYDSYLRFRPCDRILTKKFSMTLIKR